MIIVQDVIKQSLKYDFYVCDNQITDETRYYVNSHLVAIQYKNLDRYILVIFKQEGYECGLTRIFR